MKKRFILIAALCVSMSVFCACYGITAQTAEETLEPLASLKAAAAYMESTLPADTTEPMTAETAPDIPAAPETTVLPAAEETTEAVQTSAQTEAVTTAAQTTAAPETHPVVTQPAVTQPAVTQPPETRAPETTAAASQPVTVVTETPAVTEADTTAETQPQTEAVTAAVQETESDPPAPAAEEYLNFDVLREVNPDIYAWLQIEGTIIDDPVLQNAEDDTKYLTTGYDNTKSTAGALYTEASYNGLDFNDPVTVIYGHRTIKGHMFGALQPTYSDAEGFSRYSDIKLYLPGEVRHYTVFAAVPYDSIHILYTYDFTNTYWYKNFFKGVKNIRALGANLNEEAFPEPGDRVIILSACLEGDKTKRYLVMAVLQDDLADNISG